MKERFSNFMQGRNGADAYGQFLNYVMLVLAVLNLAFFRNIPVNFIILATMVYSLYRTFSKNLAKRQQENDRYLLRTQAMRKGLRKTKRHLFGEGGYKYFSCPECGAELRVPKKKGKIKVRCPKCNHETIIRS